MRRSTKRLQTNVPRESHSETTTSSSAHRGNKDDSSVRALAVKPRAYGAPLRGYSA